MSEFQFFSLFKGKETPDHPAFELGVPYGIKGPVTRVVWARLVTGRTHRNLLAQVEYGEPGSGKIVINEGYSTFGGKEGDWALVGITSEVQKYDRDDTVHKQSTRFYGMHAAIVRYWADCPAGEVLYPAPIISAGEVTNTLEAALWLARGIAEKMRKSTFRVDKSLPVRCIRSGWMLDLQRTVAKETRREAA